MLIPQAVLHGILHGSITLGFRRWRRPTVRAGGTLLTAAGQLQILSVDTVPESAIADEDARRAGYSSRDELLTELNRYPAGNVYRIEFGALHPDPRVVLRETVPDDAHIEEIAGRLERLDRAAPSGPWTKRVLEALADHAGMRSIELAVVVVTEPEMLKRNVRKLKNLGLTISLGTGYRLSPRGEAVLEALRRMP